MEPATKKPRLDFWQDRQRTYAENWNKNDIQSVALNYAPQVLVFLNGKEVARTFMEVYDFLVELRRDTGGVHLEFAEESINGSFQSDDAIAVSARFTLGGVTGGSKKTWKYVQGSWHIVCDDLTFVQSIPSVPSVPASVVDRKMVEFEKYWNADDFEGLGTLYTQDAILILNGSIVARTPGAIGKFLGDCRNNLGYTNFKGGRPITEPHTHYDTLDNDALEKAQRKMTWAFVGSDWKILLENTSPVPLAARVKRPKSAGN